MIEIRITTRVTGASIGITMCRSVDQWPAPSSDALSSSSFGIVIMPAKKSSRLIPRWAQTPTPIRLPIALPASPRNRTGASTSPEPVSSWLIGPPVSRSRKTKMIPMIAGDSTCGRNRMVR